MRRQPDTIEPDVEDEEEQSRVMRKKEYRQREAKGWIISLAAAIVIALALRFFVFEFIRVEGPSMQPTLYTNEYVFMEKVTYWFRHPERGDIVICSFPASNESFVKRVIGMPGERIKVEEGVLYINDVPNYDYFSSRHNDDMLEMTVPDNSVMVMGDNRNESRDSREPTVGPIPYDKILGRAVFVIWPFDKIHGL
jgi:signal peptidase I